MIKLIIADDEPLVQAGIKSMIDWEEQGISIVGTASNGAYAYELIQEYDPQIVITDIKMPVMSGLELAAKCQQDGRKLPIFIILTSYEEFHFVKEAITYQVADYLIKLELTPEMLLDSLQLALKRVSELQKTQEETVSVHSIAVIKEQFYTHLIFHLFETEHQFEIQAMNLGIDFNYDSFIVSYIGIMSKKLTHMTSDKQINLYNSSLQMARELIAKYIPHITCHVLSLDTSHFCVIFFLDKETASDYQNVIKKTLEQVSGMLFNYFSVNIYAGIGSPVHAPLQLSDSYQEAKEIFTQVTEATPILFAMDSPGGCDVLQNADYKHHIVFNVKKYINEHIEEKLTLNKVAKEFNISPNYLSILFSKHNDIGFSDYINQSKIEAAKTMMNDGNYKIYEISDKLGFESAFYFSRVFKKMTGVSPRDYMSRNLP
ncbi:MAG: response regulator [Lachnospiraceae bacterium]|nr:response regulator [Lachnospiraceae bacterium]